MLWHPKTLQNLAMYNVFFIFGRFSIAGKLPKWPKIPFQYPLGLRHPKILEKCRKHHRILVSVRDRFWGLVSVRNRFCPPPAKADIATAILTNVIEHLVLLLPPNKHAFTAKAVWADLNPRTTKILREESFSVWDFCPKLPPVPGCWTTPWDLDPTIPLEELESPKAKPANLTRCLRLWSEIHEKSRKLQ